MGKIIASFLLLLTTQSFAAKIDKSLQNKIAQACEKSLSEKGSKTDLPKGLCQCVGEKHFKVASKEADQKQATKQINWVLKFYETSSTEISQKMVDDNETFSSIDDQVIDDCTIELRSPTKK